MVVGKIPPGLLKQCVAGFAAYLSILVAGACNGWITPIMTRLTGNHSEVPMTEEEAGWVASVMEPGSWFSTPLAGALSPWLGRKPLIMVSAPLFMVSWLMVLYLRTALWLGVARFLQGFAMEFVFAMTPIYLGEIASSANRGFITGMFFTFWWLGMVISYAVGPYLSFTPYTWFEFALNIPFLLLFLWQPETPHYHLLKGDPAKAKDSLKRLRDSSANIEQELEEIWAGVKDNEHKVRFVELFATPGDRRALALLVLANAIRITNGIAVVLIYATEIFELTASSLPVRSDRVTLLLGLVMFTGGTVGSVYSDSLGRRPLILLSSVGTFLCLFSAATYYYLLFRTDLPVAQFGWFAPLMVLVFAALCSVGMYPVCSSYTSELFTTGTRGYASSLSALSVVVCSFIVIALYTPIKNSFGVYTNFYMWSAVSFFGTIFFYFYAVETKGKSFLQIRNELNNIT